MSPTLNINGKVNFIDLAELGKQWVTSQKVLEDLSGDEIVTTNWLWEKR
jgi:hypothetical protein